MVFLIIIVLVLAILFIYGKSPMTIKSHPWNHFYDNVQISTSDFYRQVEEGLKARQIKGLKFGEESFMETHIFSTKRAYLRITQNEYLFYVCAAPFGTGTFVSWWLCVKDEKTINRIPLLSKLAGKDRNNKTFYQMDTESMYQSAIHSTVVEVADSLTKGQGIRLSDTERQYKESSK